MQNNNEVLKTSVLVIGQSGVGKSSLLNYIFNKEVEKTGVGNAVTKQGIFPHTFKYDESFIINIYDTWGLEPNKNDDWEKLITESIRQHDKQEISEWYNTIIICINASSDRVQDFEINIIKKLIELRCNIVVAVTNCKNEKYEPAENLKQQLIQKTTVRSENIIFVNSVSKKLIGSTTGLPTFGRDKLLRAVIGNLWYTFKHKVPQKIQKNLIDREILWLAEENKAIDRLKFPIVRKNHTIDSYVLEINHDFDVYVEREVNTVNQEFRDAIEYYSRLSKKFVSISLINSDRYKYDPKFDVNVRQFFSNKVDNTLEKMFSNRKRLIELANTEIADGVTFKQILKTMGIELGMYMSNSKSLKNNLKQTTRSSLREFNQNMMNEIDAFQSRIQSLNIEKVFLEELK